MRRSILALAVAFSLIALTGCTPGHSADQPSEEAAAAASAAEEQQSKRVKPVKGDGTVAERLQRASLEAQITQALVRQKKLRIFDFDPQVRGSEVVLRGDVNTRDQQALAGRIASGFLSGRTLINDVTVRGQSLAALDESPEASGESASRSAYHTVQAGESLWQIAKRYNASVRQIRQLNDLSTSALQPGQRLRVR
jgi:LysM repeat protein